MNIKELLQYGNNHFINSMDEDENKKLLYHELVKGQNPLAIIITCSDSRVIPEEIFSANPGQLFVIRTAGNVINEGELASIEYGIAHLNIKYILVLGHTKCGAIHASIHNEKGLYLDPIIKRIKCAIRNEVDKKEASRKNAIEQVKYIKNMFPNYEGEITSALYDLETNEVEFN